MKIRAVRAAALATVGLWWAGGATSGAADDALRRGWDAPPEPTKPHVYWYWLNNVVTTAGITRDLEAMAKNGVGGAYVAHVGFFGPDSDTPQNATAEPMSEAWYDQLRHAVREGLRTGVKIGVYNGPGWSQSGGPWVRPGDSMVRIDSAEVRVPGGRPFAGPLPRVRGAIDDVRTVAFPAPADDGSTIPVLHVTGGPGEDRTAWADGQTHPLPAGRTYAPLRLTFEFAAHRAVRSIAFRHGSGTRVSGTVLASEDGHRFEPIHAFTLDRRGGPPTQVQVRSHPSVVALPPTTARFLRVEMPWRTVAVGGNGVMLGVTFSAAARVESFDEKQLNVASRFITPPWDAFVFPPTPEPGPAAVVSPGQVLDLTARVDVAAERLNWDVPPGDWIVQRFSTVSTGARNGPAPAAMTGLETDKMSRTAIARHLDLGPIGQLWRRLTPAERLGFNFAVADSYEKGFQNWTPGLEDEFRRRLGYDAVPFLPVLGGRVVASAAQSDRFLWDLRRLVADLVSENYVGGLTAGAHARGLTTWLENYGHYGFPGEFLSYGGASDGVGGEVWSNKPISHMETRGAAAAAHVYGKPRVSCEIFTAAGSLTERPGDLKTRGDLAFALGVNHYVLHVVSHQPTDVPGPGLQLLWGTYFNRKSLWFAEHGRAWVDYVRRSCFLLQQGRPVADVAYFIGEDVPQMTGLLQPPLPPGYDYDFINADVLLTRSAVTDGRLTLPGGASYRVLVLPPVDTMRPRTLARIAQLVRDGLTVLGPPPQRSPSLQDYPGADDRVRSIASDLWPADPARRRSVGLGQVWTRATLGEVLGQLGAPPAVLESNPSVLWKQRSTAEAEVYFLSNQSDHTVDLTPSFAVAGRSPEVWDAETGRVERPAAYREGGGRTAVPLSMGPSQALFVLFRRRGTTAPAVTDLTFGDRPSLAWDEPAPEPVAASNEARFGVSFWVDPAGDIRLPRQGVPGANLGGQRWVVSPPRGELGSDAGAGARAADVAVAGISVGRNGVAVFQRSAEATVASLVWPAPVPMAHWTHVVVAYRRGVPHLYVGGREVQAGVSGGRPVVPGDESTAEGTDSGSPFEPNVWQLRTEATAPGDASIAAAAAAGRPATAAARVLFDDAGALHLRTRQAGHVTLRLTDGRVLSADVAGPPPPRTIIGPWDVTFAGAAAPVPTRWDRLGSWADSADDATRYFSGTATYMTAFDLPGDFDPARTPTVLDLGRVGDVARARVNGQAAGTALREPYRLDVGQWLHPGRNTLGVVVTNNWAHRMIGDERFPDDLADARAPDGNLTRWPDWAFTGRPRPEPRRITLSARRVYSKDSPLQPAGLMGPVRLKFENDRQLDVPGVR